MIVILIALIFGIIVIYQSARSTASENKGRQRADSGFFDFPMAIPAMMDAAVTEASGIPAVTAEGAAAINRRHFLFHRLDVRAK